MELIKNQIIPNNPDGTPLYPIVEGDTYYSGSSTKLNSSPSQVRLYTLGDTEFRYTFWNKNDRRFWKVSIEDSIYYNSDDKGLWNIKEMAQAYIYEHVEDAYKYMLWSKINNGTLKDYLLYPTPLEGANICKMENYVGVGETFSDLSEADYLCDIDTLEE